MNRLLTTLALTMMFVGPVLAQDKAPGSAGMLKTAEEVLARYVQVTGGKDGYAKIKSYISTGTMEMPASGLKAPVKTMGTMKPLTMYMSIDLGQFGGTTEQVVTEKATWSASAIQGTRVLTGSEEAQMKRAAAMFPELTPEKFFKEMSLEGVEKVGDEDCYKVKLTPKEGKPEMVFYSVKSGLRLKNVMTMQSPQGEMQIESQSSDYRDVGPIKMPFKAVQKFPNGMSMSMVTESIEVNKPVDDAKFKMPAAVAKQLEK
ncbi:MAG: hypothetical protein AAFX06_06285 [Planctomycetota bacterium]